MEILADKLRPKKIDDIIGQDHLIGKGKILSNLVKNKKIFSMIFYGFIILILSIFLLLY